MRRQSANLYVLLVLVAGGAVAQQTTAPTAFTQVQSSGIVGITGGQTARLNLLNLSSVPLAGVNASCSAQVTFMDDSGQALPQTQTFQNPSTVTVDSGKSMHVDYPSTASVRQQIRVTVGIARPTQMAPTAGSPIAIPFFYCSLVPTLEIFDNSLLKTTLVVSDFHYVYAYPIPLMGVATGSVPPMR